MKTRTGAITGLIVFLALCAIGATLGIKYGKLQSDLDAGGFSITNALDFRGSNAYLQIITGPATNQFGGGGGGVVVSNVIADLDGLGTNTTLYRPTMVFNRLIAGTNIDWNGSLLSGPIIIGEGHHLGNMSLGGPPKEFILGGVSNAFEAGSLFGSIVGGAFNLLQSGHVANQILGGTHNTIDDAVSYATVIGGRSNRVGLASALSGSYSTASGFFASATNDNVWIWSDGEVFASKTNRSFLIAARNGVGINTNNPGTHALRVEGNIDVSGPGAGFSVNGVAFTPGVATATNAIANNNGFGTNTTLLANTTVSNIYAITITGPATNQFGGGGGAIPVEDITRNQIAYINDNTNITSAANLDLVATITATSQATNFWWNKGVNNTLGLRAKHQSIIATDNVNFFGLTNFNLSDVLSFDILASGGARLITFPTNLFHMDHADGTNALGVSGARWTFTLPSGRVFQGSIMTNLPTKAKLLWRVFDQ